MTGVVIDASIALAWCFHDEATPASWAVLDRVESEPALVPSIWSLELANVLVGAERRGRIGAAEIAEFLERLEALDIQVDGQTANRGLREILSLARAERLTSYDAAYLDLAMREGAPLATRDHALADAALRCGVKVIAC